MTKHINSGKLLSMTEDYFDHPDDDFPTCSACHKMAGWGGCDTLDCPKCKLTEEAKAIRRANLKETL